MAQVLSKSISKEDVTMHTMYWIITIIWGIASIMSTVFKFCCISNAHSNINELETKFKKQLKFPLISYWHLRLQKRLTLTGSSILFTTLNLIIPKRFSIMIMGYMVYIISRMLLWFFFVSLLFSNWIQFSILDFIRYKWYVIFYSFNTTRRTIKVICCHQSDGWPCFKLIINEINDVMSII